MISYPSLALHGDFISVFDVRDRVIWRQSDGEEILVIPVKITALVHPSFAFLCDFISSIASRGRDGVSVGRSIELLNY